ncbi:uncharacterized protein LOC120410016 isoform X2 [Corvus cornix cornix]|uniref:uncharacterized protein LOC120410016 isoform X2 n=1 Tax=Corvus cornix cornix TaxID=932674 RepID=UPI001950411B|nr:uncharacterized protein LOC120410016 isoform X2 [Corvus cornix cornix]
MAGSAGSGAAGPRHRGGCSGLGAKNIQNCLLTLMDSRNAFHSSCFGMGMAVGSSGRTRVQEIRSGKGYTRTTKSNPYVNGSSGD